MATFHMPGSFNPEGIAYSYFDHSTPTPSSSLHVSSVARSPASYDSTTKRKRKNPDDKQTSSSIPRPERLVRPLPYETPRRHRLQDIQYALAGQLSTPGAPESDSERLGDSAYSESNYRKALGARLSRDERSYGEDDDTAMFTLPLQPSSPRGWGSTALGTIGGVMGKLWSFCTSNAFKGFYAGGGTAFEVKASGTFEEVPATLDQSRHDLFEQVPGYFPDLQAATEPMDGVQTDNYSRASTPTSPSAKRRQTERHDELGRNWVMVKEPQTRQVRHSDFGYGSSPRNRNQGPSPATRRRINAPDRTASQKPTPRQSLGPLNRNETPPAPPRFTSQASRASARSPSPAKNATSYTTPSTLRSSFAHRRSQSQVSTAKETPRSASSHRRSTSTASAASPRGKTAMDSPRMYTHSPKLISRPSMTPSRSSSTLNPAGKPPSQAGANVDSSPRLDPEAKKLAAKRQRAERDRDVRMDDFNQRLQDMIRQGKEALGTSVEVDEDEGWDEEL